MLASFFSSRRIWNDGVDRPRSVLERLTVSAGTGGSLIAEGRPFAPVEGPGSGVGQPGLGQVHPRIAEHQVFTPQRLRRADVHQQHQGCFRPCRTTVIALNAPAARRGDIMRAYLMRVEIADLNPDLLNRGSPEFGFVELRRKCMGFVIAAHPGLKRANDAGASSSRGSARIPRPITAASEPAASFVTTSKAARSIKRRVIAARARWRSAVLWLAPPPQTTRALPTGLTRRRRRGGWPPPCFRDNQWTRYVGLTASFGKNPITCIVDQ